MILNELFDRVNTGEKSTAELSKLNQLGEFIKTNCSEYLFELKSSVKNNLFRGMGLKNESPPIFLGQSRNDRRPKDSDYSMQTVIDDRLQKLGYTALRRNSIFCTTNMNTASGYGNIYVIFPLNGFSFTWSENIEDLFYSVNLDSEQIAELNDKEFDNYFDFNGVDFVDALNSGNEIMIHGKYVAVRYPELFHLLKDQLS